MQVLVCFSKKETVMKTIGSYIISVGILILSLYSCIDDPELTPGVKGAGKPVFSEEGAVRERVTASSITVSANVLSMNGSKITERGFCYSISPDPTLENSEVLPDAGVSTGSYTLTIENLNNNTPYYIRPYATNELGTEYGKQLAERTNEGLGEVETIQPLPAEIWTTSMKVGGRINMAGEGEIFERGIYYSTSKDSLENPDASRDVVISGEETEEYMCLLERLKPETTYYFMAFVKNTYGTFWADKIDSAMTKNGLPVVSATVVIDTGFTHVTLKSEVRHGDDNTVAITERGFCWSTSTNPTIGEAGSDTIRCGVSTGVFEGTIDGLTAQQQYYVRAYAINEFDAIVYGEEEYVYTKTDVPTVRTEAVVNVNNGRADVRGTVISEGMFPVTSTGICWAVNTNDPKLSNGNNLPLVVGSGNVFSGQLTGLRGGTIYYVRAYAANSKGISYGDVISFETPPVFDTSLSKFSGTRVRNSTAYFKINNDLYLLGGDLGAMNTDELWRYSSQDGWVQRRPFPASAAKWQTTVGYGTSAFVFGGLGDDGTCIKDLYRYDSEVVGTGLGNEWVLESAIGPDSLYLAVGYSSSNSIYFVGGRSDTVKCTVWEYQVGNKLWQQKTDFPVKQYGGMSTVINGVAYVGMGKDDSGVCNGTLWSSDNGGLHWTEETQCVASGISLYNGSILAGVGSETRQAIYVIDEDYYMLEYNLVTNTWTRKSRLPSAYRTVHCMYEIGGKIYIGLGTANALVLYDPSWDFESSTY